MSSVDRLKDIRALEFFLFGGIPEAPEFMFERDSQHHVDVSRTRRGFSDGAEIFVEDPGQVIEIIEIDPATGSVCIRKYNEHASGK